ncbi:MAG: hypothetical protein PVI40_01515 [Chlamydiota bacterium]|jgi:tetratricopeptide (TPR) repeat protein
MAVGTLELSQTAGIQKMSIDAGGLVLECLDVNSLLNFGAASKETLGFATHYVKLKVKSKDIEDFKKAQDYIDCLLAKLDSERHMQQITNLNCLKEQITGVTSQLDEEFPNLSSLVFLLKRSKIFHIKKSIITELFCLNDLTIENLKQVPLPNFFHNLFELFEIYDEMESASVPVVTIFGDIIEAGKFDIEMVSFISKWNRDEILEEIAQMLADNLEWDNALEVISLVSCELHKSKILIEICKELAYAGEKSKALEVIHQEVKKVDLILDEDSRDKVLVNIFKVLIQVKEIDYACKVASFISSKLKRNSSFRTICRMLIADGQWDKVIEVAELLSWSKVDIFKDLIKELLSKKIWDKALDVVGLMPLKFDQNNAFVLIYESMVAEKQLDEALKVVNLILDEHLRNNLFRNIVNELIEIKEVDKALEVTCLISYEKVKTSILIDAAKSLYRLGEKDKAIKVVNKALEEIPFVLVDFRAQCLVDIAEILKELGELDQSVKVIDQAIEVAELIPNELVKKDLITRMKELA